MRVMATADDVVTPLKISAASQLFNVILDPILIFRAGLGVAGASMATGLAAGLLAGALGYAAFFWIAAGLALLAVPALFWATRAEPG